MITLSARQPHLQHCFQISEFANNCEGCSCDAQCTCAQPSRNPSGLAPAWPGPAGSSPYMTGHTNNTLRAYCLFLVFYKYPENKKGPRPTPKTCLICKGSPHSDPGLLQAILMPLRGLLSPTCAPVMSASLCFPDCSNLQTRSALSLDMYSFLVNNPLRSERIRLHESRAQSTQKAIPEALS